MIQTRKADARIYNPAPVSNRRTATERKKLHAAAAELNQQSRLGLGPEDRDGTEEVPCRRFRVISPLEGTDTEGPERGRTS